MSITYHLLHFAVCLVSENPISRNNTTISIALHKKLTALYAVQFSKFECKKIINYMNFNLICKPSVTRTKY